MLHSLAYNADQKRAAKHYRRATCIFGERSISVQQNIMKLIGKIMEMWRLHNNSATIDNLLSYTAILQTLQFLYETVCDFSSFSYTIGTCCLFYSTIDFGHWSFLN